MESILGQFLNKETIALSVAAITVMSLIGRIHFKGANLNKTFVWKEFGFFLLAAVCISLSFLPGVKPSGKYGETIIFGLVVTFVAHSGKKVINQFFKKQEIKK
jgi:hypothetical protein